MITVNCEPMDKTWSTRRSGAVKAQSVGQILTLLTFYMAFREVLDEIQTLNANGFLLKSVAWGQFHQHYMIPFLPISLCQKLRSQNVTKKSCAKHFCTKNVCIKCWWNRPCMDNKQFNTTHWHKKATMMNLNVGFSSNVLIFRR